MISSAGAAWCAAAGVCKRAAAGVRWLARAMASARRLARRAGRGLARVGFGAQERAAAVYAAACAGQRILMTNLRHRGAPASPQTSKKLQIRAVLVSYRR